MLLDEVIIGDIDIFEERRSKRCDAAGMNYYILLKAIGASRLKDIPDLLSRVIEAQYWKKWRWTGNDFEAVSIDAYVSAHPPKGLGARVELIERLLADKPEVLKLFRRARRGEDVLKTDTKDRESQRPHEQPKTVYNGKSAGNSSAAFLRRLRKDRPDIHARVLAGKLTPQAGMVEAGYRKPRKPRKQPKRCCPNCRHEW